MKKVLLIGKMNSVVKEINQFLSQYFHVQLCSENANVLEGMVKIVHPDLVLISLWYRYIDILSAERPACAYSGFNHRHKGGERSFFQILREHPV